jgi:hypothetical protein
MALAVYLSDLASRASMVEHFIEAERSVLMRQATVSKHIRQMFGS